MAQNLDDFDFHAFEQWLKRWSGQKISWSWFLDKVHKRWCDSDYSDYSDPLQPCIHHFDIVKVVMTTGLIKYETESIKTSWHIAPNINITQRHWVIVSHI